jgi:hypothetical protein
MGGLRMVGGTLSIAGTPASVISTVRTGAAELAMHGERSTALAQLAPKASASSGTLSASSSALKSNIPSLAVTYLSQ